MGIHRVYKSILIVGAFRKRELPLLRRSNVAIRGISQVRLRKDIPAGTDMIICAGDWDYEDKCRIRSLAGKSQISSPLFVTDGQAVFRWLESQGLGGSGLTPEMKAIADTVIPREGEAVPDTKAVAKVIKRLILDSGHNVDLVSIYRYLEHIRRGRSDAEKAMLVAAAGRKQMERVSRARARMEAMRKRAATAKRPAPEPVDFLGPEPDEVLEDPGFLADIEDDYEPYGDI